MSTLFVILFLVSIVIVVVFLIKSIVQKKKGTDNTKSKRISIIALAGAVVFFILVGATAPDATEGKKDSKQEQQIIEATTEKNITINESSSNTDIEATTNSNTLDEMDALQGFYDEFSESGTYENLEETVEKYGLYVDSRRNGIGGEYFKVAYSEELSKVISNSDLKTKGNYIVIECGILGDEEVKTITFHKDK